MPKPKARLGPRHKAAQAGLLIAVADRNPIALSPVQLAGARAHVDQLKKSFLADAGVRAVRTVK
jgi:hypothetical protein